MTTQHKNSFLYALAALACLGSVGCESTGDEPTPGDDGGSSSGTAGSGSKAGTGGGGKAGTGGSVPDGGVLVDGGFILNDAFVPFEPDAGGGTSGNGPGEPCEGRNGTYEGTPSKPNHFLNQCTDSQCEPFDNVERLPLYEEGKPLPALPTP